LLTKPISGIKLIYLPPYSPDLNPIEECFAFVKQYIRCRGQEFCDCVESGEKAKPYLYLYATLDKVTPIASRVGSRTPDILVSLWMCISIDGFNIHIEFSWPLFAPV
jgi:hypothetical protein